MALSVSAQNLLSLMIGLIVYVFLAAIPILGWVFGLVVTALGIGSICCTVATGVHQPLCKPQKALEELRKQII